MARHIFNFDGGEDLTTMGASWFISYAYYFYIDKSHMNWKKVSTYQLRINVFNRTINYHKYWFKQIRSMKDCNLNKNTIELDSIKIKELIKKLM